MRSKFVLVMSILMLSAAVVMSLVSRGVLVSDKESYLYEDIGQSVSLDSLKVLESSSKWQALARSLFSNAMIQKQEDSIAKLSLPSVFFNDNPHLIDFRIYRRGSKEFSLLEQVNNPNVLKDSRFNQEVVLAEKNAMDFMNEAYQNLSIVRVYKTSKKKNAELELRIGLYDTKNRFGGIFRFLLSKSLDQIKTKRNFQRLLVGNEGKIYYLSEGESDVVDLEPIEKDKNFLSSLKTLGDNNGVQNVRVNGENYIVGFSQIPALKLTSLVLQNEGVAYAVQASLFIEMGKVAIVFVLLVSILIFVFTGSIVKSVDSVNEALDKSLEGNYTKAEDKNSGDEFGKLVKNYNKFVGEMQKLTSKLSTAKANLEKKVEGRTNELKNSTDFMNAMIETLDQGLFIFTRSGKILPMYTSRTEDFLGKNVNLRNAKELLPFANVEVAEAIIKDLFESGDNFDEASLKAPQEIIIHEPEYLYAQVDYYPLRSPEGFVQFVGVVITDRTEAQRLNNEASNYRLRFETLKTVAKSKVTFLEGYQHFEKFHRFLMQATENSDIDTVKTELIPQLGKIKKFMGSYCDSTFQKIFQALQFDMLNSAEQGSFTDTFAGNAYRFDEKYNQLNQLFGIIMGESLVDKEQRQEIKKKSLLDYREKLMVELNEPNHTLVETFNYEFLKSPIESYFKGFSETLQNEAQKSGKYVMPLEFENGSILVDRLFYQPVFESFKDLFIFIANESIEERILREEKGKEPLAKVKVEFEVVRKKIEIRVIDDGKGIDPNKLRETMEQNGFSEEQLAESDEQIINHFYDIYMKGFKEVIESNGGAAILASKEGEGTTFKFRLPMQ